MSFLGEVKRRKLFQVAATYLVVAWLILQVVDVITGPLQLPASFPTIVIVVLAIGFPMMLVVSWFFEITPDGFVRDEDSGAEYSTRSYRIEYVLVGLLVLAVAWIIVREANLIGFESDSVLPNSVAVLPFENLSPDPDDAIFAAGMHREIISTLTKVSDLNVISRTSVMQYDGVSRPASEIAAELGVQAIIEGSVRFANDRVRIVAQLVDAGTGANLWGGTYERAFSDVFPVQTDIASGIAAALQAELLPQEQAGIGRQPTISSEAYGLVMRAIERNINRPVLAYLDAAIEIDPGFAMAWGLRATAYEAGHRFGVGQEDNVELERLARENAMRALELDPREQYAHVVLARLEEVHWRGAATLEQYETALELSPNNEWILSGYGEFMRNVGEVDESIRLGLRSVELDPRNFATHHQLGHNYFFAGRLDEAYAAYEMALELNPGFQGSLSTTALIDAVRGNHDEALRRLALIEQLASEIEGGRVAAFQLPRLALAYALADSPDDAQRSFDAIEERHAEVPVSSAVWGLAYLALGDYERALVNLRDAVARKDPGDFVLLNEFQKNLWQVTVLDEDPRFVDVRANLQFEL